MFRDDGRESPTAAFALSIQGRSGKEDTQEKKRCPRTIFVFFWPLVQFQISVWAICPSLAAALFLLGCLGYLFCFIFQFIFTNFEQPGRKGSKLAGYFPHILYSCAVCLAKPRYKRLSRAERTQDPSSSM